MEQYITRIRTESGDLQIDYNALANLPDLSDPASIGAVSSETTINGQKLTKNIVLTPDDLGISLDDTLSEPGSYADAAAVGAALEEKASVGHSHTAADIGAAEEGHTHTLEELGAASSADVEGVESTISDLRTEFDEYVENMDQTIEGLEQTTNAITPMDKGGTGSDNGAAGLANLFAAGPTILSSHQYGYKFPTGQIAKGTLFFKCVSKKVSE